MDQYVQYFCDCAVEVGEMTSAGNAAVMLWGDSAVARSIIDGEAPRRELAFSLERYAISRALVSANVEEQRSLRALAYNWFRYHASYYAEIAASWAYTDATVGGCREAWKPWSQRRVEPTDREAARLLDRRMVKNILNADVEVRHVRRLAGLLRALPAPEHADESDLVYRALRVGREEEVRQLTSNLKAEKESKKVVKPADRKAVKRAAAVAVALLGASAVSAFAAGKPVEIPCGEVVVRATKAGGVHAVGHGALSLSLVENGRDIADLCWYVPEVNALDQLVTLKMYADTEPEEVLLTGNVFGVTSEGSESDFLKKRSANKAERSPGIDIFERQDAAAEKLFGSDYAERVREFEEVNAALRDDYVLHHSDLYVQEYLKFVLGRDEVYRRLRRTR